MTQTYKIMENTSTFQTNFKLLTEQLKRTRLRTKVVSCWQLNRLL